MNSNASDMPVGTLVPDWSPRELPPRTPMEGIHCRVEPFDVAQHANELFQAYRADTENRIWTYLTSGPFEDLETYRRWAEESSLDEGNLVHAVIERKTNKAVGVASYMRIDTHHGVIEVGSINYSPALQRTTAGTEAMYLMMKRVFDELGYRRYEWKCDNLNAGSKRAANRYGFSFEGIFRQAVIVKRRNRDTAWFAIIDTDWPAIKAGFEAWLSPENLGRDGQQKLELGHFMPA